VNPDEVVAIGASIQGGVLKGDVKDVLLLDVTPLTLAIETAGGIATPMIAAQHDHPEEAQPNLLHLRDNQPGVEIVVLQGERPMSRDNKTLGTFKLDGIPPHHAACRRSRSPLTSTPTASSTSPRRKKSTGKEQKISIQGSSGLSKDEIEKAKRDAEEHAEEDRKRKEGVEVKNKAEASATRSRSSSRSGKAKSPPSSSPRSRIKLASLKSAIEANDTDAMKAQTEELEKLFAAAYQAAAAAGCRCSPFSPACARPAGTDQARCIH
jgi:molecular chaperone DnaK